MAETATQSVPSRCSQCEGAEPVAGFWLTIVIAGKLKLLCWSCWMAKHWH